MKHKYLRQSAEMASLCAYNYTQSSELTHQHTRARAGFAENRATRDLMSNIFSGCACSELSEYSLLCCFAHTHTLCANKHTRTLQLAHSHYFNGQPAEQINTSAELNEQLVVKHSNGVELF